MFSTCRSSGSLSQASFRPLGGSGSLSWASSVPMRRRGACHPSAGSAPMPMATRSGVPKRLASTGMAAGLPPVIGRSNSKAGPPARSTRSAISVISRWVSTGSAMRLSSPSASSCPMKSRRSLYSMVGLSLLGEPHYKVVATRTTLRAVAGRTRQRRKSKHSCHGLPSVMFLGFNRPVTWHSPPAAAAWRD